MELPELPTELPMLATILAHARLDCLTSQRATGVALRRATACRALRVSLSSLPLPLTVLAMVCVVSMAGCTSPEVDAVRQYKEFLVKAKPSLTGMNKARQELYDLSDLGQMLPIFEKKLLPEIDSLKQIADAQPKPTVAKLGAIHEALQATLKKYDESTHELVKALQKNGDDQDKAILAWGVDDQKFGKEMTSLVNDLSKFLDELRK